MVMIIPSRLVVFFVIDYNDLVLSLQCIKKNLYFVKNYLLNPLNQDGIVLLVLLFESFCHVIIKFEYMYAISKKRLKKKCTPKSFCT